MLSSWRSIKPCHFHTAVQHNSWIKLKPASPMMGCGLSCSLHIIIDDKHTIIKEVRCCWFLKWRNATVSNSKWFYPWFILHNSETHAAANLWGKWDCIYFSNQIQLKILPAVENTARPLGLFSFRINKYVFSKITAASSNLWDHPNPTHLDSGMELNNCIWFEAEVTTHCPPPEQLKIDTERKSHHLVALGQKSSSSINVSPPEIICGKASRFQNQQHLVSTSAITSTLFKKDNGISETPAASKAFLKTYLWLYLWLKSCGF